MAKDTRKDEFGNWEDTPEQKKKYAELAGPKKEPTIIDKLIAFQLTAEQLAEEIIKRSYGTLAQFYQIPSDYRRCLLSWKDAEIEHFTNEQLDALVATPPSVILDPCEAQLKAIAFFQLLLKGDEDICLKSEAFFAKIGVNFYGPPGTGKTHIMAAFGNLCELRLKSKLDQYRKLVSDWAKREYAIFIRAVQKEADPNSTQTRYSLEESGEGEIQEHRAPAEQFMKKLEELEKQLLKLEFQPTDLMYIGFDPLCELARDEEQRKLLFAALEKARLVFIDDVHPKGDTERAMIVQQIIERRYEQGRRGTFMTTNLSPDKLAGDDEQIQARLLSRCGEMMLNIDFTGARDWRAKVNARRVTIVADRLEKLVAEINEKRSSARNPPKASEGA